MTSTIKNKESDVFEQLQNFGKFHTLQYFWTCLPLIVVSMTLVNYAFVAEDTNYRCIVPECEADNPTVEIPMWWPNETDAKCFRPVIDPDSYNKTKDTCFNTTFLQEWEECHDWVYESNNSIVAGLNLGCQSWIASFVGSIHNTGMIASMLLAGWVSDKIGRKPALIICSVGGFVGVLKMFVTNYIAYLGIEFLDSFLTSGIYTVGVVLLVETGGQTKRVMAGVIFSYATYIGEMLFALLAMYLRYWKSLILVAYSPLLLFISYCLILRESTRWQMLRGKMEDAKYTFKSIARMNKLDVTPKQIDEISDEQLRLIFDVQIQKEKESMREIMRSKEIMIRLAVTSVCFFSASFTFCGLMVNSVLLPGNKYTNFALTSLTAFPGDLLAFYTFNKYGRKLTLQYGYFFTAIFIIAQAYTPETISWLKILLYLLGKFGVVVCFTGIFTYSMELFPTSVRGTLVGCGNTAARVGSMLAPLTPLLKSKWPLLTSILFSSTSLFAGILLVFTPETKSLPMFDTIAQVEDYERKIKNDQKIN